MRITKFRTAIAMLAATFAVTAATAPIADAAKNTGKYQQSSEAKKKKQAICGDLKDNYDEAKANYKSAMWRGQKQRAAEIEKSVEGYETLAQGNGCAWAQ